jgi:hypothetical protein
VRIPPAGAPKLRTNALAMLANRHVLTTGVMIFFSVATELGLLSWISGYFKAELGVSLRLASSVTRAQACSIDGRTGRRIRGVDQEQPILLTASIPHKKVPGNLP